MPPMRDLDLLLPKSITRVILMKMKTAVSIPDPVFERADATAKRLKLSRSALYGRALAKYLDEHDEATVTDALDRVYANAPAQLDPALLEMQAASLPNETW